MGRPTSFSQEKADRICERLAEGDSLREICDPEEMPSETTVYRWLRDPNNAAFRQDYARAREDQADNSADRVADLGKKVEKGVITPDVGRVAIDAEKWSAGVRNPKKYGQRMQLANDPENPIQSLTDDQLEAKFAALMEKSRG